MKMLRARGTASNYGTKFYSTLLPRADRDRWAQAPNVYTTTKGMTAGFVMLFYDRPFKFTFLFSPPLAGLPVTAALIKPAT
jgi:hypothetical protein